MDLKSGLFAIPHSTPLLTFAAQQIIERHQGQLPDLTRITILIPDMQQAPQLRDALLQAAMARGYPALMAPRITSLPVLAREYGAALPQSVISNYERELLFVEAVRQHRHLFGDATPWQIAEELLKLFDELNLNNFQLPDDIEQFVERITQAYGPAGEDYQHLARETELIFTLWHAWHQQLRDENRVDNNLAYLAGLSASLEKINPDHYFYLLATLPALPAEQSWLTAMVERNQLCWIAATQNGSNTLASQWFRQISEGLSLPQLTHDEPNTDSGDYFDTLFATASGQAMRQRAAQFAKQHPQNPIQGQLRSYSARGAEDEANAIALQVRDWLLQGKQRIAIVTENRKQARRVRALLERAEVTLHDRAGWALSTTSAATIIERWLQCVEEDFAHQPLLDLMRSPFLFNDQGREQQLSLTYRFEQDIVLHENIAQGMSRYLHQIPRRKQRLPENLHPELDAIAAQLQLLQQTAEPLQALMESGRATPEQYLSALLESLEALQVSPALNRDEAGQRVLQELEQLKGAAEQHPFAMQWGEFRAWVGRSLERYNFQPNNLGSRVELLGLKQSLGDHYDALIIAGMEQGMFPPAPTSSPFFNHSVRHELGLPSILDDHQYHFYLFRCLLQSAPTVLLTLRHDQDGEEIIPSPWFDLLTTFNQFAYQQRLHDEALQQLLHHPDSMLAMDDGSLLPQRIAPNPSVVVDNALLPSDYSASSYQQLVNCPYQFFVARCLGLSATDEIKETLEKSDYGELVHACLEAFHQATHALHPFPEKVTEKNRDKAISWLEEISRTLFAQAVEDNFQHRGWLTQWLALVPLYIDWLIGHQPAWHFMQAEQQAVQALSNTISLKGRIDRIDHNRDGQMIIDYKTSSKLPKVDEVLAGERVQLPFYALLQDEPMAISHVNYLQLERGKVATQSELSGEALQQLAHDTGQRLKQLTQEMAEGKALPAWGDEESCSYCDMSGICRRKSWQNSVA